MALHSARIGGVQVAGTRYVVYGVKRGFVSTHRTKRAALRSLAEDASKCQEAGQPSDAQVYHWCDGWEVVDQGGGREVEVGREQEGDSEETTGAVETGHGAPADPASSRKAHRQ